MNKKMMLTIAAVAIAALVGFGVMTQEQGDKTEGMLSNLSSTMESGISDAVDATQELAADAESLADDAMNKTEPAAGEAEEMMNKMEDAMSN